MTKVNTLAPEQDMVLVKADPVEAKTETDSGIILPDEAQAVQVKRTGTVVAVGPDAKLGVIGTRYLFSAYAGTEIEVGGEVFDLMRDSSLLARIT